ncbi:XAP5, circadian clock regulator-domain-containing protein [Lentinula edodes]|nr:XAP5, circadian clock regulator-domain-containing protein [Lentinula edodes]
MDDEGEGEESISKVESESRSASKDEEDADGDGDDERAKKWSKLRKNPNVDTSFLPDREREEAEREERERLRQELLREQEELKNEDYWDGSGHQKTIVCKKGDAISTFLDKCRQQFPELRGVSVDNLMYVKEDFIIPQVTLHFLRLHSQQSPWQLQPVSFPSDSVPFFLLLLHLLYSCIRSFFVSGITF